MLKKIEVMRKLFGENSEKKRSQQIGICPIQTNNTALDATRDKLDEIQAGDQGATDDALPVTPTQQNNTPDTAQHVMVQFGKINLFI